MCTSAVSHLLLDDEAFQGLLSNPLLDLIHKQMVLVLYSLDADKRLHEYREWLPVYFSKDWSECSDLLKTIEAVGLITRTERGIELTHKIQTNPTDTGCGCGG